MDLMQKSKIFGDCAINICYSIILKMMLPRALAGLAGDASTVLPWAAGMPLLNLRLIYQSAENESGKTIGWYKNTCIHSTNMCDGTPSQWPGWSQGQARMASAQEPYLGNSELVGLML